MEIILMDKVANLGNLGDVVNVKNGYARNFLIPQGMAKRATKINVAAFEVRKAELEKVAGEKLAAEVRLNCIFIVIWFRLLKIFPWATAIAGELAPRRPCNRRFGIVRRPW